MTVNNPASQADARRGTQEASSVLIVGAGNFGASAALHFAKQGTPVTLVDTAHYPNPRAASHDINKIVRDDYPDTLYMEMLRKAMPLWRKDKLYSPWYHEVGMLRADPSNFGDKSMQAYREVGIANDSRYMTVEEVRERWEAYSTSNFDGLSKVLYNPMVGFAEADKALGAVVQAAIDAGTHYEIGEMSSLALGPTGECRGIHLKDGRTLYASQILMATGARTPALLAQSAPGNKDLHIGDRLVATGAVSFHAKLHGAQKDKFASVPVLKNCMPQVKGEGMSILPDGTIKFNCDMCFTNYQTLPATGEKMSLVPESNFFNTWTDRKFLDFFERRARMTINGLYGDEVKNVPIDAYRMCWDASTPTHDFLITAHPHSQNLYIATGGSFHGWKFLPVIGDYIVQLMGGTLSAELTDRWAWDKKGGDGHSANPTYQVVGDLQDWTDDIEYA